MPVFRRCVADRLLSGAGQNFLGDCSQKGKCKKAKYFAVVLNSGRARESYHCQTAVRWMPRERNTIAVARRTSQTIGLLSSLEHLLLNLEAMGYPVFPA